MPDPGIDSLVCSQEEFEEKYISEVRQISIKSKNDLSNEALLEENKKLQNILAEIVIRRVQIEYPELVEELPDDITKIIPKMVLVPPNSGRLYNRADSTSVKPVTPEQFVLIVIAAFAAANHSERKFVFDSTGGKIFANYNVIRVGKIYSNLFPNLKPVSYNNICKSVKTKFREYIHKKDTSIGLRRNTSALKQYTFNLGDLE